MAETAGSVQFGLTLSPLDRALQPSTKEALERVEEDSNSRGKQMEEREDVDGAKLQKREEVAEANQGKMGSAGYGRDGATKEGWFPWSRCGLRQRDFSTTHTQKKFNGDTQMKQMTGREEGKFIIQKKSFIHTSTCLREMQCCGRSCCGQWCAIQFHNRLSSTKQNPNVHHLDFWTETSWLSVVHTFTCSLSSRQV